MASLKELLDVLHESVELSSADELKDACKLIIRTQEMSGGERDVIRAAYRNGPLDSGDIPSKSARNKLEQDGFMVRVVVNGSDGFNACTHKGAWAYRLIEAEDIKQESQPHLSSRIYGALDDMYRETEELPEIEKLVVAVCQCEEFCQIPVKRVMPIVECWLRNQE